jgi:hypothetical protein
MLGLLNPQNYCPRWFMALDAPIDILRVDSAATLTLPNPFMHG